MIAPLFVHFTGAADAAAIVRTAQLQLSRIVCDAVYAVAAGGRNVPGVQQTTLGTGVRTHAVVFRTVCLPDCLYPEEVIWHRTTPLPIDPVTVLPRDDAVRLLDDALAIPDDGLTSTPLTWAGLARRQVLLAAA